MSILALRTAIVDAIDTGIPALRTCQAHGGRFDVEELRRWAIQAPAVVVACLGSKDVNTYSGQVVGRLQFVAYVITAGTSAAPRSEAILTLAESVAALAANNAWAYADAQAPAEIRIDNLYSGTLDKQGVALWAVTWTQRVDLEVFDSSTLDDFDTLYTDYDTAPADGTLEMQGLAQLQGTFMAAYGQLYVSTAAATAAVAGDTYYKLAGTTTLGPALDCDMPVNNRLRHTGTVSKPFLISASLTLTTSVDGTITVALAKNGVIDAKTAVAQKVTAAGGAEALSVEAIESLAANEYVELWVKTTTPANITATNLSLTMGAT